MNSLGLEKTLDRPGTAKAVRCFVYASRRASGDVLRKALDFAVVGKTSRE